MVKICGVWQEEDLLWSKNCDELSRRAYARIPMISKLKYIGTRTEDLLDVYCLYVRSILEFCAVVFHSGLTQEQSHQLETVQGVALFTILEEQSHQLETVQGVALFTILGDNYVLYEAAREMTGIPMFSERRQERVETFCKRAIKHMKMFPLNIVEGDREAFC